MKQSLLRVLQNMRKMREVEGVQHVIQTSIRANENIEGHRWMNYVQMQI